MRHESKCSGARIDQIHTAAVDTSNEAHRGQQQIEDLDQARRRADREAEIALDQKQLLGTVRFSREPLGNVHHPDFLFYRPNSIEASCRPTWSRPWDNNQLKG